MSIDVDNMNVMTKEGWMEWGDKSELVKMHYKKGCDIQWYTLVNMKWWIWNRHNTWCLCYLIAATAIQNAFKYITKILHYIFSCWVEILTKNVIILQVLPNGNK